MQIGSYVVEQEIARGGVGVVYRARHLTRGTPVAIKVLLSQHLDPGEIERFRREAEATFRLRHPHVVGLLEFDYHDGHPYLVLELIEGESLQDRIDRETTVVIEDLVRIGEQVADALHYAHSAGLVHRDIKPHNILLEAGTGRAVLTDFGLAQFTGAEAKERLTVTGEVVGTPAFMAPEQALGDRSQVGPFSDVYSLAATLYAGVCGKPPFDGELPLVVMQQVVTEPPPHPLRLNPQANPALSKLVMQCLAKVPRERGHDAESLREALRDLLARTTGSGGSRYAPPSKAPLLVAFAVAAAMWLLVGLALGRLTAEDSAPTASVPPSKSAPEQPTPPSVVEPSNDPVVPTPEPATAFHEARDLRNQALAAYDRGEPETVVRLTRAVFELDERDLTSESLLLSVLLELERWDEAVAVGSRTLKWVPRGAGSTVAAQLAYALSQSDPLRYKQDIDTLCEDFRNNHTGVRWVLRAKSTVQAASLDPGGVLKWLQPLSAYPGIESYPVSLDQELVLARARAESMLRDASRAHMDLTSYEGITRRTTDPLERGLVVLRQGLPSLANQLLLRAGSRDPRVPRARAAAFLNLGLPKRALEAYRRSSVPAGLGFVAVARAQRLAGDEAGALQTLRSAVGDFVASPPGQTAKDLEETTLRGLKDQIRQAIANERSHQALGLLDELLLLDPDDEELQLLLVGATALVADAQSLSSCVARFLNRGEVDGATLSELVSYVQDALPWLALQLNLEHLRQDDTDTASLMRALHGYYSVGLFVPGALLATERLDRARNPRVLAFRGVLRARGGLAGAEADLREALRLGSLGRLDPIVSLELGRLLVRSGEGDLSEIRGALRVALSSPEASIRTSAMAYLAEGVHKLRGPAEHAEVKELMEAVWTGLRQGAQFTAEDKRELTRLQVEVFGTPK